MRAALCAIVAAIALAASAALAQDHSAGATFWQAVQVNCGATAAKPASALGRRIAQTAIDEFYRFGGHEIDAHGRLFRFGLTEAEHEAEERQPGAPGRRALRAALLNGEAAVGRAAALQTSC